MTRKTGEKFTAKYGVATATIYRGTDQTASVRIPPPGHPLYDPSAPTVFDELRVQAIDRDGTMSDAIEVQSDPDAKILWIVDGRARWLDVEEANRRRAASTPPREPVGPLIVPFDGDEKAAVLRIFEKNFHRRLPTPSSMALALQRLRKAGHSYEACANALHHQTDDPEQWVRKLLPIAYCIEEVRAAVDAGEFPRVTAMRFAGSAMDGSKALGPRAQKALLVEIRAARQGATGDRPATVPTKARERVRVAFGAGAAEHLGQEGHKQALLVAATLARIDGDPKALDAWPDLAGLFDEFAKKQQTPKRAEGAK